MTRWVCPSFLHTGSSSIGIKGLVPKIGQTDVRKAHELSLFVSPYVFNIFIETTLLVKFEC